LPAEGSKPRESNEKRWPARSSRISCTPLARMDHALNPWSLSKAARPAPPRHFSRVFLSTKSLGPIISKLKPSIAPKEKFSKEASVVFDLHVANPEIPASVRVSPVFTISDRG